MTQTLVNIFLLKKALSAENKNHQREIFLSIYFFSNFAFRKNEKCDTNIYDFFIIIFLFCYEYKIDAKCVNIKEKRRKKLTYFDVNN